jgi:FKBP-type peptidyl-prolyl cis-trans isomerase 2
MAIKGFEDTVIGMKPRDSVNTKILANDAYGHYVEEKIVEIERASLPPDSNPEKGQRYSMSTDSGEEVAVLVVEYDGRECFS